MAFLREKMYDTRSSASAFFFFQVLILLRYAPGRPGEWLLYNFLK